MLVGLLPHDWEGTGTVLVNAVYWPLVLIGLLLALTSFYHVVLPHRLPWRRHLPGTVLAVAFFLVAALLLRAYIADILRPRCPTARWRPHQRPAVLLLLRHGRAAGRRAQRSAIQARWPAPCGGTTAPEGATRQAGTEAALEL